MGCGRAGSWLLTLSLAALGVAGAKPVDWSQPWKEPHDPSAAANASDEYAWRLFVALNWPVNARVHEPDAAAPFGANRAVVWETWRTAGSIFLDGGADPGSWSSHRAEGEAPEQRFEAPSPEHRTNLRHVVGGRMVPLLDPLASARRLTEIRFNRLEFEFIRAHELYDLDGQSRAYGTGAPVSFPYGSREVKAKWRPIEPSDRSRYYTMEVRLADGTPRLYGLTGLHIASKDLPTWFWATFEHVDNPTQPDNEGWQLPSHDRFACPDAPADCNRAPRGIGLEHTVWQYYRLRGTLTRFVDAAGKPLRLANSELESGLQRTASCISCHARAAIGLAGDAVVRPPIFDTRGEESSTGPRERRGFIGAPQTDWFERTDIQDGGRFQPVDFVWSLMKAQRRAR